MPQSLNIPIQTPIGPICMTLIRYVASVTLQSHMVSVEISIENFTSPAARRLYAVMKDGDHNKGFTIVMLSHR